MTTCLRFICRRLPGIASQPFFPIKRDWTTFLGANMSAKTGSSPVTEKSKIGVIQLTCTADKQNNFDICKRYINQAKDEGVQMVFLPEAADYIATSKMKSMEMAESLEGETICNYRKLAQETSLWISIGGFHQKGQDSDSNRVLNTHILIDDQGDIKDTYSKVHLFDLDLGDLRLCESDYTIPGDRITSPVSTPVGNIGLGICYDLRFPEMSIALVKQGAEILTYPSAFTVTTGRAHWEILLRSRAVENQCYVVAAAQTGKHNEKRASYGHSMVIDPWGTVLAQCGEDPGLCVAEVDLSFLSKVRKDMPVWNHRRHDLYGHIHINNKPEPVDCIKAFDFGGHPIPSSCVFHRTPTCFCFVNIKPVVLGHVLVSTMRRVERLGELTQTELSDLFSVVQRVAGVVEQHYGASSLTVSVQDGPQAGQTVKHVHVHVMPRKAGDFEQNDEIYTKLQHHDKDMTTGRRSEDDMAEEAGQLKAYFT
ncbi:nitrilase homolog 1-like isoform X1 [Mizuhopecten yessoensis]|uniref:nitrilase homolog 1-like isoform X1 n=1 Tax=Mizuhopecten yessoensis TaxID=6573 RepID=UPI000B45E238|nr:nitrilase homolog 1-like isoform X1 [Mizuhopecten yessoensis]